jgi:hypothetical protein
MYCWHCGARFEKAELGTLMCSFCGCTANDKMTVAARELTAALDRQTDMQREGLALIAQGVHCVACYTVSEPTDMNVAIGGLQNLAESIIKFEQEG